MSLRFLPIGIFFALSLAGGILVTGISWTFYRDTISHVIEEKKSALETVQKVISSPAWQHQELTFSPGITDDLIRQTGGAPDVIFVRLVDASNGTIISSNIPGEKNTVLEPSRIPQKDTVLSGVFRGLQTKEIAVRAIRDQYLWIGFSTVRTQQRAVAIALLSGIFIIGALAAVGAFLYITLIPWVIRPLIVLKYSLAKIGAGNFSVRLAKGPPNEIGDVFRSFNSMSRELETLRRKEKVLAQSKSDFITVAAHKLRTPLSAFKWNLDALLKGEQGKLTLSQQEMLAKNYTATEKMIAVVEKLLDVAQIDEGIMEQKAEAHDMVALVEKTIKRLSPAAQERKISLHFEKPREDIPPAVVNERNIMIAIRALLDNAIRYSPQGSAVTVSVAKKGNFVRIAVQDQGIGIPEKDQRQIFSKFFRTKEAMRMETEGIGLDLFIAKNIVENHGGSIDFTSTTGKGSTFWITLPLKV